MTIAACYLSTEGVVLGADSTTTLFVPGPGTAPGTDQHYDFAQKIFEFGDDATVGVAMWGLGSLGQVSYRTLVAGTADAAQEGGASTLNDVSLLWAKAFWQEYENAFAVHLDRVRQLSGNPNRTPDEDRELLWWRHHLSGGFCIGGRWQTDRQPVAFEVLFNPTLANCPVPESIPAGCRFWGCPNLIERLLYGIDGRLFSSIAASGKWTGTQQELFEIVSQEVLSQPSDLPLREAIDWVYASIYTTIKAMKFSHLAPVCGGPIEIAVITSDRPFRWVKHKGLDEAVH